MKPTIVLAALLLNIIRASALSQTIPNSSFEADQFNTAPGYSAHNGGISGWTVIGSAGLNPAGGQNPFADNGLVPDGTQVAFLQSFADSSDPLYNNGVSELSTTITGLTPGVTYAVSFRANLRAEGSRPLWPSFWGRYWLSLNGGAFSPYFASQSVDNLNVHSKPYYFVSGAFTATNSTAGLAIRNRMSADDEAYDATLLVDAFAVAPAFVVTQAGDAGIGSLRVAMESAEAIPGPNTITFNSALNGQTITLSNEFSITALGGLVTVDASNLPDGVIVSGGNKTRIFFVDSGASLSLFSLNLTGGNGESSFSTGGGGAIMNFGTVSLLDCSLTDNYGEWLGGAILGRDNSTLVMSRCTLANNMTDWEGGAIFAMAGSSVELNQCTVCGNSALNGGAIVNAQASISLTHCTVSNNSVPNSGGAILNKSQSAMVLNNCIIAANSAVVGADLFFYGGSLTRSGVNIIQSFHNNQGAAIENGPPPINADPLLAPLGSYGGPTKTMALLPGSPARNASVNTTISMDQRGFSIVGAPDIGSYEAGTLDASFEAYVWESLPPGTAVPHHAPAFDYDGDGVTNEGEWIMGSDASIASILNETPGAISLAQVSLNSPGGLIEIRATNRREHRIYRLQHSDTLHSDSWQFVPGLSSLQGSGTDVWQIPMGGGWKFYRLMVSKP